MILNTRALVAQSLDACFNVPLAIGDATSLAEVGSLLSKLILATEGDMDDAQRGIVYIDETTRSR
jgi:ATP-dependent Clp protease ATP-binding subunit ClpX